MTKQGPGRPLKHGEPTVRVTAHVPKSRRNELFKAAKASGVSVSEFINIAVDGKMGAGDG